MPVFKDMPGTSRVWIYQSSRAFNSHEQKLVLNKVNEFLKDWNAHKTALEAAAEVFYSRFIVIALNENVAGASGCSIDKLFQLMQGLEKDFNVVLLDRMLIGYKDKEGNVQSCLMSEFEKKIAEGEVTESTVVFNNLIQTKHELETKWIVSARQSWHIRFFG